MTAPDDITHFTIAVASDGTVIAQRVEVTATGPRPTGAPVIAHTGEGLLAKADATRYAIGCLLGCLPSARSRTSAAVTADTRDARVGQAERGTLA